MTVAAFPADRFWTWRDGERLVRFGPGVLAEAPGLLNEHGFTAYALLTTPRARASAASLVAHAAVVVAVPEGQVPDVAAAVRWRTEGRPLVALGGGRVIDVAKAIGSADGRPVAAIPTTLSGAELNSRHRPLSGAENNPGRRPVLVVTDPDLLGTLPPASACASAMNALAHAVEALITPDANPIVEGIALTAAARLAAGPADRDALALGGLLAGVALDAAGFAIHHVVCQSLVRTAGTPHATTNAVLLPHATAFLAGRAPRPLALLAKALGGPADAACAAALVAALAAGAGVVRLRDLGVAHDRLGEIAKVAGARRELGRTPGGADVADVEALLAAAW